MSLVTTLRSMEAAELTLAMLRGVVWTVDRRNFFVHFLVGMGLPASRTVTEVRRGRFWAEHAPRRPGVTFHFTLLHAQGAV